MFTREILIFLYTKRQLNSSTNLLYQKLIEKFVTIFMIFKKWSKNN